MKKSLWKKAGIFSTKTAARAEALFRRQERFCVGACFRYRKRTRQDTLWYTEGGLLFYTRYCLFPVFERPPAPVLPRQLEKQLEKERLHAAQGLSADLDVLEKPLEERGCPPAEIFNYDLMQFDCIRKVHTPPPRSSNIPPGLILRRPGPADADALFSLQEGYEREEVMPKGAEFYPAACRKTVENLISGGLVLAAELEGRLVGKININAESYTRCQVGGVYVDPAYRGRGIARAMTEEFIRRMETRGKGLTLFVRKNNLPAQSIYVKAGFVKLADYRIVYY